MSRAASRRPDGMVVALTNPYAWPQVRRGSEAVIHGLASWLSQAGHQPTVLAGGSHPASYAVDGVPVRLVKATDLRRGHHDLSPEVTFIPGMAWRLRRLVPDVVHCFLYQDATAARVARRPYVVSYGGIALPEGFTGHRLLRRLLDFASSGARALVCPSRAAADHLLQAFGFRAEVIPNGLNTASFTAPAAAVEREPDLILCAAAADDRRKRVPVLVDSFRRLVASGRDCRLALAGPISDAGRQQLLDRLPEPMRGRVEFLGPLDEPGLAQAYGRAAVSCLPSLHEAFGMVVVESMAAGTPVVATAHGALPELITDETGITFPPDDELGCAGALAELLDRNTNSSMGEACRARARQFDWASVGPRYVELYHRAA